MTRILASDGSDWLHNLKDEDMTYEHKPHNPNHGGVSRSGRASGFDHTDRHPSDIDWFAWALRFAIAVALICAILGVTAWADVPFEVAA